MKCDHDWEVVGASFASDAQVEEVCTLCGQLAVQTRATLNPGIDTPGLDDPFLYDDPELRTYLTDEAEPPNDDSLIGGFPKLVGDQLYINRNRRPPR